EIGAPVLPAGSDRPASDGLDGDRPVGPGPLVLDKLRHFYNHPGFLEAQADRVRVALGELAE
ncbi:MAG: hypothetical protein QOC98_1748, partial [Frankiaceae bacterium]|nr:hypothetical protein [Frankiaceae bacterium]